MKKIKWILAKITRNYEMKSLQYILSISFTFAAIVVVLGVLLWSNLRYTRETEQLVVQNNENVLEQVNLNLDTHIHTMMNVSDTVYYEVIKNVDLGKEGTTEVSEQMKLLYNANSSSLVSISIFSDEGELIVAQPYTRLKENVDPQNETWFMEADSEIENIVFSTPHVENLFVNSDNIFHWVISLSRSIEITENGSILHGVMLVNMNLTTIEQICDNVDLGDSGYIYIIDKDGEIIYHPDQQLIYGEVVSENNMVAATYSDGSVKEVFEGEERYVTVKTVGYTGWKIVGVSPVSDVTEIYEENTGFLVILSCIAVVLLVVINLVLSSKVANPIKKLEKSVLEIERNNLDAKISISGTNEVRHLGNTIQSMVDNMKQLMKDIVKEQEGKRKSEMDALQSQINPHFLYNTLDSIVWMVENERYEGAITMVTSLAKLFRISLSKGRNIITIEQEMQHVENYLIIQDVRYKKKFSYEIEIEADIKEYATIKLIVQPLVENAIYHAMEYMDGDGELRISARSKNGQLIIEVGDNGPGMTEEQVEKLTSGTLKPNSRKGSGIGFRNVQERIRLFFGNDEYGIGVESEPDEGTKIRITIPLLTIEQMEQIGGGTYEG